MENNEIKTIHEAIKRIDNYDYSWWYSDDFGECYKAKNERIKLEAILDNISNPEKAILQQCFKDSCENLGKVDNLNYKKLKKEIIKLVDPLFRDDIRAIMRNIIGESAHIVKFSDGPLINKKNPVNENVCGFRYDEKMKEYIFSTHPSPSQSPWKINKRITHEIAVKDIHIFDVEYILNSLSYCTLPQNMKIIDKNTGKNITGTCKDAKALLESGALSKAERQKTAPKEAPATVFEEYKGYGYSARTYENARKADLTLALAVDFTTAGEKCTEKAAGNTRIPVILNGPLISGRTIEDFVRQLITDINLKCRVLSIDKGNLRLNIAGNGIYTLAKSGYTQADTDKLITDVLAGIQDRDGIHISSIRSGGQTGVDEAGIKAGVALGLPTTVLAPKGWAFRTANRQDIFSEAAFKARFSTNPKKELAKETPVKAHSVTADGPTWTPCRRNDGLMNYRDAAGHVLLKNWVDDALPFKDGKAECRIGKTGYIIDTKGIVIDRARWTAQSQSNTNGPKI